MGAAVGVAGREGDVGIGEGAGRAAGARAITGAGFGEGADAAGRTGAGVDEGGGVVTALRATVVAEVAEVAEVAGVAGLEEPAGAAERGVAVGAAGEAGAVAGAGRGELAGLASGPGAGADAVVGVGVGATVGVGVVGADGLAGGVEAVVFQSAPGARRERRTGGRRWTGATGPTGVAGATGAPSGVPGLTGEAGPGTFWGRPAAEGSGAAVEGAVVGCDPLGGAGAGPVARWTAAAPDAGDAVGRAAPAGVSCRGGWTGRAETSGERRTGMGRTGPGGVAPADGVAACGTPPAAGPPAFGGADVPAERTGAPAGAAAR
ncbi:hypothetical protein ACGFYE_04310 [Streptomyces zaomyceticus]|uniref:hypothetical protein n=1 Tax=Streptomyces zaomyceticus TaxID=68286 RepID=UPI0037141F66